MRKKWRIERFNNPLNIKALTPILTLFQTQAKIKQFAPIFK